MVSKLAEAVRDINDEVEDHGSNAPLEDFYYKNTRKIEVEEGEEEELHRFCLDDFESLDFLAVVTSSANDRDDNNDLRLNLYQDGRPVVTSVDDGDSRTDDNSSLALHYKTKVGRGTTCFALKARATRSDREIPVSQLQVGYKVYGPGHDLTIKRN